MVLKSLCPLVVKVIAKMPIFVSFIEGVKYYQSTTQWAIYGTFLFYCSTLDTKLKNKALIRTNKTIDHYNLFNIYFFSLFKCQLRATPYELHPCISVVESEKLDSQGQLGTFTAFMNEDFPETRTLHLTNESRLLIHSTKHRTMFKSANKMQQVLVAAVYPADV